MILDILLSQFWTSLLFHVQFYCCFLTFIHVSQEAGKIAWYSHLFKNFPQFSVIHIVKGFSVINEAEVDYFGVPLVYSIIQQMLAILSLAPLPFLNPACTSGSFQFPYCWSLSWRILSITLLACEMSAIIQQFEHSLALPFFGIRMKTDLFQSCGHCWVFQICWHIECSTFTAKSYKIRNSWAGIPSPPLALLVVIFLRPTWLHIPGGLSLGKWPHHQGYPGH